MKDIEIETRARDLEKFINRTLYCVRDLAEDGAGSRWQRTGECGLFTAKVDDTGEGIDLSLVTDPADPECIPTFVARLTAWDPHRDYCINAQGEKTSLPPTDPANRMTGEDVINILSTVGDIRVRVERYLHGCSEREAWNFPHLKSLYIPEGKMDKFLRELQEDSSRFAIQIRAGVLVLHHFRMDGNGEALKGCVPVCTLGKALVIPYGKRWFASVNNELRVIS